MYHNIFPNYVPDMDCSLLFLWADSIYIKKAYREQLAR